jgi:hypothetical protein
MFTFGVDPRFHFFLLTLKPEVEARFNGICVKLVAEFVEKLTAGLEVGGKVRSGPGCKFVKLGKLLRSSSVNVKPLFAVELVDG